jgi:adenylate cyclase
MKRISLFVLLLALSWICASTVSAQSRSLSEIEKEIRRSANPAEKLPLLVEAAQVAYRNGDRNAYRGYGSQANKLARQVSDPTISARAFYTLGVILREEGNYRAAIPYFKQAVDEFEPYDKQRSSRQVASRLSLYYQQLGICYEQLGQNTDMERSMRYAAVYARSYAKDPGMAAKAYNTLGDAYRRLKQYEKARQAFVYSREEAQKANRTSLAREAQRKIETIETLISEQQDREQAQNVAEGLSEDVMEKEAQLEIIQDSLDKVEDSLVVEIRKRDLLALEAGKRKAELQAKQKDLEAQEKEIKLIETQAEIVRAERDQIIIGSVGVGALALLMILGLVTRSRIRKRANRLLAQEKQRSDDLLLEILPANIADELKQSPENRVQPVRHQNVSILFTDFKGFSSISETMDEEELVGELEHAFRGFDQITEKYGMEKIKTIGDAYMAAAGLVKPDPFHALNAIAAAMEMQAFMHRWNLKQRQEGKEPWKLRVGINSGEVVAGVVGSKKFAYDIWGKAVNLAARMETAGEAGKVNVSSYTYALTKDYVRFGPRRSASVKNIGEVDMYFVEEIIARRKTSSPSGGRSPHEPRGGMITGR